jgi:hypothetical protein
VVLVRFPFSDLSQSKLRPRSCSPTLVYFLSAEATMMAASISAGDSFESGPPRPLFAPRIVGGGAAAREYAVARDGRFLINQPVADAAARAYHADSELEPRREAVATMIRSRCSARAAR